MVAVAAGRRCGSPVIFDGGSQPRELGTAVGELAQPARFAVAGRHGHDPGLPPCLLPLAAERAPPPPAGSALVTRPGTPPVVRLASHIEYPARHRDGDTVGGELVHERIGPFPILNEAKSAAGRLLLCPHLF